MKIAIDYDDTITEYRPYPERAPIRDEAALFIRKAHEKGHTLYLYTSREGYWLKDAISCLTMACLWHYFTPLSDTGKPKADYFIDDRASPDRQVDWQAWLSLLEESDGIQK